jgi:hypothetical protein
MSPKNQAVLTPDAPGASGPYSQAVVAAPGSLVFCSGQIALSPLTGQLVGTTAAEQTEQVMANLAAVLRAAGCGFDSVVRTTIFLAASSIPAQRRGQPGPRCRLPDCRAVPWSRSTPSPSRADARQLSHEPTATFSLARIWIVSNLLPSLTMWVPGASQIEA